MSLTAKVFDTLVLLVQNSGRLLLKDELMGALWPDSFVEEVNLSQNISVLRKALGESAHNPHLHRHGARSGISVCLSGHGDLAWRHDSVR